MITLEAGYAITPGDIDTYTQGECWYLAWILSQMTGWEMVFCGDAKFRQHDDWCHVLVRTPTGDLLDVFGVQNEAEALRKWNADCSNRAALYSVPMEEVREVMYFDPADVEENLAAETIQVAKALLAVL